MHGSGPTTDDGSATSTYGSAGTRSDARTTRSARCPATRPSRRSRPHRAADRSEGRSPRRAAIAREVPPTYDSGAAATQPDERGELLGAAIDALAEIDIDALEDDQLAEQLASLRLPMGRLRSLQARWAAALESRRIAAAPPQRAGAAQRNARNELSQQQQLTPSETKRLVEAGRAAKRHEETGRAFADGRLTPDHVRVLDLLLNELDPAQREELEPQLVELASHTNASLFGRKARALIAAAAPEALAANEDRLRGRRYLRCTSTPDGGFAFSGLLYGTAAETALLAIDAFTRPDAGGEHRTPEQRAADGFEQLCAAALRAAEAPTQHGARPQVLVAIDAEQLAIAQREDGVGHARFLWSGQPVTTRELGHLLDDCSLTGVLLDARRTPIEVTTQVRRVPMGLWRALQLRDGGCTWEGCDAPAAWCDVAHGTQAYRHDGRLHPGNAALLCRSHHRRFDLGPWRIEIDGDRVRYVREHDPP